MARGPARRLTNEAILTAAFAELEARGARELSLRGLAAALGVAPGALYTYMGSKNALMREMVEHVLGLAEHQLRDSPTGDPTEDLREAALVVHRTVRDTPGAASLLTSGPLDGTNALTINERLLSTFMRGGLSAEGAARASYVLQVYVLGSSLVTSAGAGVEDERPGSSGSDVDDSFPLTRETSSIVATYDSDVQFEWGLDSLLAGLMLKRAP